MDGGAWWAAVHGVARSRTRLSDFTFTFMHWRRKWQPFMHQCQVQHCQDAPMSGATLSGPMFLLGGSQGWGSLVGCRLWGHTELDMTEVT